MEFNPEKKNVALSENVMFLDCAAHRRPPVASIATISLLLFVFGSIVGHSVAAIVHRQIRPIKQSYRLLAEHQAREKSKGGDAGELQRFFEVAKPITTGKHPVETIPLLYHEFANTYGIPPPNASYVPTKKVLGSKKWTKVVLKWSAVCRGRQFDRIAAVWLGGVEIFRTCTAEPTPQGIIWEMEKDVTRYASLWMKPQEVVVSVGNVVDGTYTGIINVTLSVSFYHGGHESSAEKAEHSSKHSKLDDYSAKPADVILPIGEASFADGGYWFQLSNESDKFNTSLQIPPNTYKAVLEVCVSPHGSDEFWYTNPPNVYIEANNLTNYPGNGAFREVLASIDGNVVGAVYPFVVVYTGGVNPLFWRPAAAISAFDLPSYDIDITPLVGNLLDGKNHTFGLTVTDALYLWLLQANLHIWLDPKRKSTSGSLVEFSVPASNPKLVYDFKGLDGTCTITASRTFSYVGYVDSSFGNLTTSSSYTMKFSNTQVLSNVSDVQTVDQLTESEGTVVVKTAEKEVALDRVVSSYPFYIYSATVFNPDGSYLEKAEIVHALKQDHQSVTKKSSSFSSLINSQSSNGDLIISVNNTISGIGATQQTLSYQSSEGCYQRAVTTKNYTVLSDTSTTYCSSYTS